MKLVPTIVVALVASLGFLLVDAYTIGGFAIRRGTMTMKRGRGSFKKEARGAGGNKSFGSSSAATSSAGPAKRNWQFIPNQTTKALPQTEGKVVLMETNLETLKDNVANPTGAVSMVKYEDETFCFSSSCPTCKIPLTKAKVLPSNEETESTGSPRIACDFCKSTYNLKTGEKLASQEATGLFGGIAKGILSAQESGPLPTYQLGEKDGKILISFN